MALNSSGVLLAYVYIPSICICSIAAVAKYNADYNAGIDTPESRTTDKEEKVLGLEVKDRLKQLISSANTVVIRTEKPDSSEKYGRILGWLFLDGAEKSVNEALIADGYAWGYMGDTKVKDFALLRQRRLASGK